MMTDPANRKLIIEMVSVRKTYGKGDVAVTPIVDAGLQVWVDVNQRDVEQVTVGQQVLLQADAWRGRTVPGRVAAVMPKANLQRNTVEVKIEILSAAAQNDAPWLRPEMSVQVTFPPLAAAPSTAATEGTQR